MTEFWNGILTTKQSDETKQVLGKPVSYTFFHDSDFMSDNQKSSQYYWT